MSRPADPPPGFARVEALFHAALDLPAGTDVHAWLDAREPDTAVRADVMSLLAAHGARRADDEARRAHAERLPTARYGPYVAVAPLGRGGMSVVYRARRVDGQFDDTVALKVLAPLFQTPEFLRRFERERQLLATLRHHHVATLIDGGVSSDGEPFLVTELVDGLPLDRHADALRLDVSARLALLRQVCDAVGYAHRRQVVHGDLKPGNILVNPLGLVKLLDFGTARLLAANDQATATHERMLTPRYASPEQLRGERSTIASDVYALGVLAYELLTGASPFGAAPSIADGLARAAGTLSVRPPAAAVTAEAAALRATTAEALAARLAGPLTGVLAQALAFDPGDRYVNVETFAAALDDGGDGRSTTRERRAVPATFAVEARPARHRPALAASLVAGLLALAGLALASIGRVPTVPGGVAATAPTVTVAVLPIANETSDPALAPFVDVLADDLAEALARVPTVRVTARTSTLAFASPQRDLTAIGAALGVRHVVTGRVSRDGDRLRVDLGVSRTADGHEIWSTHYTTPGTGMFRVAQTAAADVLHAVDSRLDAGPVRSDVTTPRDERARDAYARGRYFIRLTTAAGGKAAVDAFDECRHIEPEFGRCHSGWAHARSYLMGIAGAPAPEDLREVERAMARAVELEPGNATALANLGGSDILYRYDWPSARTKYLRAVQVSPRLSLEAYAGGLALVGRLDESEALFRRALEWDPLSLALHIKLAGVLISQGRIDEAKAEYAAVDTIVPNHPATVWARLVLQLRAGDTAGALVTYDTYRKVAADLPAAPLADVVVLAHTGHAADALAKLQAFEAGAGAGMPYALAAGYAQLGRPAEAVAWLLRAIERHDPNAASLVFDTILDPIRQAPEFRAAWEAVPKLTEEAPYPGGPALRH